MNNAYSSPSSFYLLQKSWKQYEDGKFDDSIKTLNKIKDKKQIDHKLGLLGLVFRKKADSDLLKTKKNLRKIEKSLTLSKINFLDIRKKFPNSSWNVFGKINSGRINLPIEIALTELRLSELYHQMDKPLLSIKLAHSAFNRLNQFYTLLTFESLTAYSESCKKEGKELCNEWLKILISSYEKESDERKLLLRNFPELSETPNDYAKEKEIPKKPIEISPLESQADQLSKDLRKAILKDDPKMMIDVVENYKKTFTKTHELWSRMQYWEGVAKKNNPLFKEIIENNPLDYYSVLSSFELKVNLFDFIPLKSNIPVHEIHQKLFFYDRAKNLLKKNLKYFAAIDLLAQPIHKLKNNLDDPIKNIKFARVYSAASLHQSAFFNFISPMLEKNEKRFINIEDLKIYFPSEYNDLIKNSAESNKIDPLLISSLIRRESFFEASTTSPVGAMGLMQIMYYTARSLNSVDLNLNRVDLLSIENSPEKNIELGSFYLSSLIKKFNNISYALASYNAGPTALSFWLKPSLTSTGEVPRSLKFCTKDEILSNKCNVLRTDDMRVFIETIPYTETRRYVASIFRNYFFYKKLVENKLIPLPSQWIP